MCSTSVDICIPTHAPFQHKLGDTRVVDELILVLLRRDTVIQEWECKHSTLNPFEHNLTQKKAESMFVSSRSYWKAVLWKSACVLMLGQTCWLRSYSNECSNVYRIQYILQDGNLTSGIMLKRKKKNQWRKYIEFLCSLQCSSEWIFTYSKVYDLKQMLRLKVSPDTTLTILSWLVTSIGETQSLGQLLGIINNPGLNV